MDPKEKAIELYSKYDDFGIPVCQKIQCSIIAVNELIEAFKELSAQESGRVHIDFGHGFFEAVKIELEKYNPYEEC